MEDALPAAALSSSASPGVLEEDMCDSSMDYSSPFPEYSPDRQPADASQSRVSTHVSSRSSSRSRTYDSRRSRSLSRSRSPPRSRSRSSSRSRSPRSPAANSSRRDSASLDASQQKPIGRLSISTIVCNDLWEGAGSARLHLKVLGPGAVWDETWSPVVRDVKNPRWELDHEFEILHPGADLCFEVVACCWLCCYDYPMGQRLRCWGTGYHPHHTTSLQALPQCTQKI